MLTKRSLTAKFIFALLWLWLPRSFADPRMDRTRPLSTIPLTLVRECRGGAVYRKKYSPKHVSSKLKRIIREILIKSPTDHNQLLTRSFVLHCFLSTGLAMTGSRVIDFIFVTNCIVCIAWFFANSFQALSSFMDRHFILRWDFQRRKTRTSSLIGHGFSHIDITHLTSNMTALRSFGPLAVSVLGNMGFCQLYSGGLLFSTLASCFLPPVLATTFGITETVQASLGASGAICAVITFVCVAYRNTAVRIEAPNWVKIFTSSDDLDVPLGLAGLIWIGTDLLGLFRLEEYFDDDKDKVENIGYAAHLGGSLFGLIFYYLYTSWTSSNVMKIVLSFPSKVISIILTTLITCYLFIVPDSCLQTELRRREIRRSRKPRF